MRRGTQKARSRRGWGKYKPAILLAAVLPAPAWASDIVWTNALGGNCQTGGNWLGGTAPGAADVADFTLATPYTVTFSGGATTAGLAVHGGNLTFGLSGFTYAQSSSALDPV